jgi:hypothetical protein
MGTQIDDPAQNAQPAPGPGWEPVAPLNVARAGLAGGELAGAVYAAGGWADTSSMWPRFMTRTATRGSRWRGSLGSARPLSSSEIYDPRTDRWQVLPAQLNPGRASLISAFLPQDTIVAIGGFPASGPASPATSQVDALRVGRATHGTAG